MRISSSSIYDLNISQMNQQQSDLLQTQLHLSSGKRIMTPADDPVAAARAIGINQSDAVNTQLTTNRNSAQASIGLSEGILQRVTALFYNVKTLAVNAGNGSMTNADRQSLATALQGDFSDLLGLANSMDSAGNYLFSGTKGSTQPFVSTATGVQYQGNDGLQMAQVSSSRQMAATESGADIFMRIKNGNGTFATSAAAANTGSGIISIGGLANPPPTAAQLGNSYQLTFAIDPVTLATSYTVTGTDAAGAPLPTASLPNPGSLPVPNTLPFTSGQSISFNGIQFNIQGAPANGDVFTAAPSSNVSVFQALSNMINTLNGGILPSNPASSASFTQNLGAAMNSLDRGLDKVLTVRASMGSRLSELDALQTTGDALGLNYKQTLSQLQDLDYTKAISSLTQQQTSLQAAMQSFKGVSSLSLFNYM
jgi:flagellar hook-associated protein 3 FlgL